MATRYDKRPIVVGEVVNVRGGRGGQDGRELPVKAMHCKRAKAEAR